MDGVAKAGSVLDSNHHVLPRSVQWPAKRMNSRAGLLSSNGSLVKSVSFSKEHRPSIRPLQWHTGRVNLCRRRRRRPKAVFSLFESDNDVFTASRLNASTVRIMGPGSNFATSGLGCLLTVDEFFVHPMPEGEESLICLEAESLTYFLEATEEKMTDTVEESHLVRHGIHVLFRMPRDTVQNQQKKRDFLNGSSSNKIVKDVESVETVFFEFDESKGGAKIRVIMGNFEDIPASMQENLVVLDVMMRPGSCAKLPSYASHGLVIYILEGVGIFKRHSFARAFYENEGHGVWFSPQSAACSDGTALNSPLDVTCHMWSSLRFLMFQVPLNM